MKSPGFGRGFLFLARGERTESAAIDQPSQEPKK